MVADAGSLGWVAIVQEARTVNFAFGPPVLTAVVVIIVVVLLAVWLRGRRGRVG
jgi:hypothetical protein